MIIRQTTSDRAKLLTLSGTNGFDISKSISLDSKRGVLNIVQQKDEKILILPTSEHLKRFITVNKKKKEVKLK